MLIQRSVLLMKTLNNLGGKLDEVRATPVSSLLFLLSNSMRHDGPITTIYQGSKIPTVVSPGTQALAHKMVITSGDPLGACLCTHWTVLTTCSSSHPLEPSTPCNRSEGGGESKYTQKMFKASLKPSTVEQHKPKGCG